MTRLLLRLVGALLILSALAIVLSRAPERPAQTLVARWALPPSDFIEAQGQVVHLRDEGPRGDPLPIVLLHGTASSLHTWEGWVRELRPRRRVITLDLPGFGLTGPNAAADYRAHSDAVFVLALLDRLRVARFVIGGNSLGGEVAWRVAALAPQRVQQLILVNAAGTSVTPASVPIGFVLARTPVLNRIGEYLLPRGLVEASVRNVYGDASKVTPALVDRHFELTLREGNRRALGQRLRQVERGPAVEASIAALRVPTLVLWGGRDRLIPPAAGDRFVELIPGARLVRFEALGHVPHEEDPAATIVPVKAFLGLP